MKLVDSASPSNSSSSGKKTSTFPLLVIVSAVPVTPAATSTGSGGSNSETLEWIATVNLDRIDVTPQKIVGYLNNVLDVHKSHFLATSSSVELLEGGESGSSGGDPSKPFLVEEELEIYQA